MFGGWVVVGECLVDWFWVNGECLWVFMGVYGCSVGVGYLVGVWLGWVFGEVWWVFGSVDECLLGVWVLKKYLDLFSWVGWVRFLKIGLGGVV